jgi:hypothetical protein
VAVVTISGNTSRWTNTGTINVGGTAAVSGGTAIVQINGGTVTTTGMTVWERGQVNYTGGTLSVGTLQVLLGGAVVLPAAANTHLRTNFVGIHVAGGSVVDLNDNTMQFTGGLTYDQATNLIALARNAGLWDGGGITSTSAKNRVPKNTTLGTLTAPQYRSIYGPTATFEGFPVESLDVLVKYTYYGDTDFNGIVNFDDYARIDAGFNNGGDTWFEGDFDLNGVVNFDDYALIDLAFNTQTGTLRLSTVPEPTGLVTLLAAGFLLNFARQRRYTPAGSYIS